ncbi:MAG: hypothetical protein LBT83_10955 [Tannerella sp.]|nr:hypothetical protein [Tannerella sp.]
MNHGNPDDLVLEHFPSIPDLGLEQRADIGIILKNEQEKIDQKVKQQRDKSNKKIKKILSEEQYKVFMEKRDEFQFRKEPSRQFNRPPNGQRRGDRPEGRHP